MMKAELIEIALKDYAEVAQLVGGCGDGYCVVLRPKGQHTNGGCRCSTDRYKAQRMMWAGQRLAAQIALAAATPLNKEEGAAER